MNRGTLIALEGIDGSGKSTQARLLANWLGRRGCHVCSLREPTHGPHGMRLRQLMAADRQSVTPQQEFQLFLDDRREDVEKNIQPALDRGEVVIMDRYYLSSIAYQGALGLDPAEIRRANEDFAPKPDLIIIFALPVAEALRRIRASRPGGENLFEREEYLERVLANFNALQDPTIRAVDASLGVEALHHAIVAHVAAVVK